MTPLTLVYDPDACVRRDAELTHAQDEERVLQRMIEEFSTLDRAVVAWPCDRVEGIHAGVPCVMMQGGDHPRGCFAEGEIVSDPLIDVDGRPIVVAMFRTMTDPRRGKFIRERTAKRQKPRKGSGACV